MSDQYPYTKTINRAIRAFKDHKVTIEQDDGIFRSILFKRPGTGFYHFRIVTWPGHLAISGDIGNYVFAREHDMFGWFADDKDWAAMPMSINPKYWGEKVQATYKGSVGECSNGIVDHGTDVKTIRADLVQWFRELDGWGSRITDGKSYRKDAWHDLRHYLLERIHDDLPIREAITMIERFRIPSYLFDDTEDRGFDACYDHYEAWSYRTPNQTFLTCCAAIVWGIKKYAQAKDGRTADAFFDRVLRGMV